MGGVGWEQLDVQAKTRSRGTSTAAVWGCGGEQEGEPLARALGVWETGGLWLDSQTDLSAQPGPLEGLRQAMVQSRGSATKWQGGESGRGPLGGAAASVIALPAGAGAPHGRT